MDFLTSLEEELFRLWQHGRDLWEKILIGVVSVLLTWLLARWRQRRLRHRMLAGDARNILALEQIILHDGVMLNRSCGQAALDAVFANPAAAVDFLARAKATTASQPLVSMTGKAGSFYLHQLLNWVCSRCSQRPFPHRKWVMAPVCEPPIFGGHQVTTVILIEENDLLQFGSWDWCKNLMVEHGSDGQRILTLHAMAKEYRRQQEEIDQRHKAGKSATFIETMYLLDLGLDTQAVALWTKPVPWERFRAVLDTWGYKA